MKSASLRSKFRGLGVALGSAIGRPRQGRLRPGLERLETRAMLATDTWLSPTGGDWDYVADWSLGAMPDSTSAAVFPDYGNGGYVVTHAVSFEDNSQSITAAHGVTLFMNAGNISSGEISCDQFVVGGTGTLFLGTMNASALIVNPGGQLKLGGTVTANSFTVEPGGSVTALGTAATIQGQSLTNRGTIFVGVNTLNSIPDRETTDMALTIDGDFTNGGTVNVLNDGPLTTTTMTVSGAMTNSGYLNLEPTGTDGVASVDVTGTLTNASGGGIIGYGGGTLATPLLDNHGVVAFTTGGVADGYGGFSLQGDYTQESDGTLQVDLGVEPTTNSVAFAVSGKATLAGEFLIDRFPGFDPSAAKSPTVFLTYASLGGAFAATPPSGGFGVTVVNQARESTMAVVSLTTPADFSGTASSDLAVFRPSTDQWLIRPPGGGLNVIQFGDPTKGDEPVPGDYEGIGQSDLAVFRPSSDLWIIKTSTGGTETIQFGDPTKGDIPVPGDYDDNGTTELAVFRPSSDLWIVRTSPTTTRTFQLGDPTQGDLPVPGDYGGNGMTEAAVYRPSAGLWIIQTPYDGAKNVTFGNPGDIPTPGAYDSLDAAIPLVQTDVAVYRPSTGQFVIMLADGRTATYAFGAPDQGDVPVNRV